MVPVWCLDNWWKKYHFLILFILLIYTFIFFKLTFQFFFPYLFSFLINPPSAQFAVHLVISSDFLESNGNIPLQIAKLLLTNMKRQDDNRYNDLFQLFLTIPVGQKFFYTDMVASWSSLKYSWNWCHYSGIFW